MSEASVGGTLGARLDDVASWLYEHALPFWSRVGVDGTCGFVEHLTLDARPADVGYKRLRVQARQTYVFSHAAVLGFGGGLNAAENGWRFMCAHGWLPTGGWARRLGRAGGVVDPTLDLYDQAFALLAIAWWIRASGDADAAGWAHRTLDAIDERLRAPHGVGWLSEEGRDAALLQNPHMHLLEALLALHDVTGDEAFRSRAAVLLDLFESVLFDPATGTLAEYFVDRWMRAPGGLGRVVEPGHHYEWVWLLHRAARTLPCSLAPAGALFSFAERFGCDPETGLVYDEVLDDGSVRTGNHRSWPNTEALKAHLAVFEREGVLNGSRLTQIVDNLLRYFLAAQTTGTWVDHLDARRRPLVDKIPASTLYHMFLALTELLRVAAAPSNQEGLAC